MEQIIGEHLSSLGNFRSLSLIFKIEPPFIKNSIFEVEAYRKEGIYLNKKQEGYWINWWQNGQKYSEGNYRDGKQERLWGYWNPNGQKQIERNYVNGKEDISGFFGI